MADRVASAPGMLGVALTIPLLVWSAHFLAVYILSALVCEGRVVADIRLWVAVATAIAAVAIVVQMVWHGVVLARYEGTSRTLHAAAMTIAGLSLVSLAFVAYPAFSLEALCT
ncbi:hypothetical protein [Fodinicurvata sp. EGI_FJ10296]|uniref:hypothetical protein n=1 Tax=Fodinicurvata sp. EGI_FJ10296 TaxID=3231908 RepID=UPI0034555E45